METEQELRDQLHHYRKNEQELKRHIEELTDFVENASMPLHWVDAQGIIIWANQAELDALGYTKEEYVGFPIRNFHADQEVIDDILNRLGRNETLKNYNARLRCKNGSIKHVLINSNVFRKAGKFIHTRCFTRDISDVVSESDRKNELLNRLEESEVLLRMSENIISSSYDAIISKDLDGIVTSWNQSAEKTFGYTAEEMIGKPLSVLMPIDRLYEEFEIYDRLRNGERVEHFETKRVTKDKRVLDVSLAISPVIDKEGKLIGLSKIVRDITEKKLDETRKNDFVAMVSHELKTPLTSILGYVQMLLVKAKKNGDTFGESALGKTEAQARKMIAMIQDFLNIGRLEEGKIRLSKELFNVDQLANEMIYDISLFANSHNIIYKGCAEAIIYADRDKIGQVLTNLISNAIKYSPQGSTIAVTCEKLGDKAKIAVNDSGVGISTMDQKELFKRYYRVQNKAAHTIAGFGIGLYLVSEILRLHGTSIEVDSVEGVGSTFYFSFPLH